MTTEGGADVLLLPEGTRLLHIGPHKTGTTSLQAALYAGRQSLVEQGVRHAGRGRNPASAVRAVTGQPSPYSEDTPPPMRHWHALVRDIRRAREPRVVVSSEFFSWAKPDAIRQIVDALDPARVHVAVTLRPLGRIIPSQWQQNIQAGIVTPFDTWLHGLFPEPPKRPNPAFWTLHRHDELIARWEEVVGPANITAVVVDDRDHAMVLRVFERLLGLREGTLVASRDLTNRSLTLPEVEAVRAFNVAFKGLGLSKGLHARVMRFGAAQHMKLREPEADEPRIEIPQWAVDRIAVASREIVDRVAASGARVVGDLELLTEVPAARAEAASAPPVMVPPRIAAEMALGVLVATGTARKSGPFQFAEPIEMARVPTYQVLATMVMRGRSAAEDRIRGVGRRLRAARGMFGRAGTDKS